jgi:hypothetical protein
MLRLRLIGVVLVMLWSSLLGAQELTNAQKANLKTAILAEAPLASAVAARRDADIAAYCNAPVVPAQIGWKVANTPRDIFEATNLNEYIARSVAERNAYDLILRIAGESDGVAIDATRGAIRSAIVNIFSGATNSNSRAAILTAMTEPVTWCQSKLGGPSATTDTVTAVRRSWAGTLSVNQVSDLLN